MLRYAIIRILWLIPILICVTFIVFTLVDFAPGTVVDLMITPSMTPEQIGQRVKERKRKFGEFPVLIRADYRVRHEHVAPFIVDVVFRCGIHVFRPLRIIAQSRDGADGIPAGGKYLQPAFTVFIKRRAYGKRICVKIFRLLCLQQRVRPLTRF